MSVLRETPFGGRFHRPRRREMSFEEAMDASNDPLILQTERDGSPIRDITIGRVHVVQYTQSSQLNLAISLIENFVDNRENWTRDKEDYLDSEENFAKSYFTLLCYVKRNIDWNVGGKPPVDRDGYEGLLRCYNFEPFRKHWSENKKRRAIGYLNTIVFYYEKVNLDRQEEMLHQIQRNNELTRFTGIVN